MKPNNGLLIYNPASGSADQHEPAELLANLPKGTALHEFQDADDPIDLTRAAIDRGHPWIAVAGGDGTVEAVASALVDSPVVLGVIPCGTYNNFARSCGLPPDPLEAARVISAGRIRAIDVGFVNDQPFFESVGAGLDAAIFPIGEEIKSGGFWKWFDLLRIAARYRRQVFDITLDRPFREALTRAKSPPRPSKSWRKWLRRAPTDRIRIRALMVTVSNGPLYGANFAVAPDARVEDGMLTITIFKKYNKLELWWHFLSISAGRRVYAPRVITLTVKSMELAGPARLEVHKDGAPLDQWPLEIRLRAKCLRVFENPDGDAPIQEKG
jgi:diacylglycerol kinase (ATP)